MKWDSHPYSLPHTKNRKTTNLAGNYPDNDHVSFVPLRVRDTDVSVDKRLEQIQRQRGERAVNRSQPIYLKIGAYEMQQGNESVEEMLYIGSM